jgi:hypothetical protein
MKTTRWTKKHMGFDGRSSCIEQQTLDSVLGSERVSRKAIELISVDPVSFGRNGRHVYEKPESYKPMFVNNRVATMLTISVFDATQSCGSPKSPNLRDR